MRCAKTLQISLENHHRAVDDAECTAEIFVKFVKMLKDREIISLDQVNELGANNTDKIKKMPTYHAILLATNDVGRINLYRQFLSIYFMRPVITDITQCLV